MYTESMKKGFALPLIIGLVLSIFILAAVSLKYVSNNKQSSVVASPAPIAQETPSPKPSPSPSPAEQQGAQISDETTSCTENSSTGIPM